jgi:hypothetical protein
MPADWKSTKTIVFRKPGKSDYSIPKAYHPVEIASCIRWVFGVVITEILSHGAEKYNLLPDTQLGTRLGCSMTDALHLVVKHIRDAWRRRKHVGGLFLDIKGAYPHVNLTHLVHDMHKAGIPQQLAEWFGRLGG